jgi:clan AA aspartic protease
MMTGSVLGRHPTLDLRFRDTGRPDVTIEFVVDTGFGGFLTLPSAAVAALGLQFRERIPASLADGSFIMVETYTATILWDGMERDIEILATGRQSLLDGHDVTMQFVDGGLVTINPLASPPSPRA